jgi:hypothetical protein
MVKTSPEKLAAALKANLKRRKQAAKPAEAKKAADAAAKSAKKPEFP